MPKLDAIGKFLRVIGQDLGGFAIWDEHVIIGANQWFSPLRKRGEMKKSLRWLCVLAACWAALGCGISTPTPAPATSQPLEPATLPPPTSAPAVDVPAAPPAGDTPTAPAVPTPITRPVGVTLLELHMTDAATGWAVGQIPGFSLEFVLRTADGGATWRDVTPAPVKSLSVQTDLATAAFFMDANRAWAVFGSQAPEPLATDEVVVWRTTDGGQNWEASQPLNMDGLQSEFFMPGEVVFTQELSGWVMVHLGAGMSHDYVAIYATRDGGVTWERMIDPQRGNLPMSCSKSGIQFLQWENGWVTGNCPGLMPGVYFYATQDGGKSWSGVDLPVPTNDPILLKDQTMCGLPHEPVFINGKSGYQVVQCLYVDANQAAQYLYTTQDSGASWSPRNLPAAYGEVFFLDELNGWFVGGAEREFTNGTKMYRTEDGGQNWWPLSTLIWSGPIQFVNPQVGWVIAKIDQASTLVKTTNGGQSWMDLKPVVIP